LQPPTMLPYILLAVLLLAAAYANVLRGRHTLAERDAARLAAAEARGWLEGHGQQVTRKRLLDKAADLFGEKVQHDMTRQNAKHFIELWALKHGTPDLLDFPRGGAGPRMTDEECEACIREIRAGYPGRGCTWAYNSLSHAAQLRDGHGHYRCPTVAKCRGRYAADEAGMMRRLRRYDPDFGRFVPVTKQALSQALMNQRVEEAKYMQRNWNTKFHGGRDLFFLDAKIIYMDPGAGPGLGHGSDIQNMIAPTFKIEYYNPEARRMEVPKVVFYAMINWLVGLCGFILCSGTSGVHFGYKAS